MKVLQLNCWFDSGSTGKIVYALHKYLEDNGDESYVIYGFGEKTDNSHAIRVVPKLIRKMQSLRSRITGFPYGGCIYGTLATLRYIKKLQPDIVHIQCMNGYIVNIYRVLNYLKKKQIPTIITNHAEFMYTGGCTHAVECEKWKTGCFDCKKIGIEHPISYFFDQTRKEWNLLKQAYEGFDNLCVCNVSDWVSDRVRQSPFFRNNKVITVFNGLDTSIFKYCPNNELRSNLNAENNLIVLHVTPAFYSNIKGGQHVIEMAERMPNVIFVIIGSDKKTEISVPSNIKFIGRIDDQKLLAQYYSISNVCLLTSLRETFSMVTAESLCCGTPVVGFKAGGPESIALPEYSCFVEQGDDDALEKQLYFMLNKKIDKKQLSNSASIEYSDQTMCSNYYRIYEELLD